MIVAIVSMLAGTDWLEDAEVDSEIAIVGNVSHDRDAISNCADGVIRRELLLGSAARILSAFLGKNRGQEPFWVIRDVIALRELNALLFYLAKAAHDPFPNRQTAPLAKNAPQFRC